MEILRKIMSQYISFMERYISKCEFLSEKEKEMAVDEMKLISFEFKEKYNDLLEAIKKNSSKINRILNETLCRLYNQPPLGSNAYLYRAFIVNLCIYSLFNDLDDEVIELIACKLKQFIEDYPNFTKVLNVFINQLYGIPSFSRLKIKEVDKLHDYIRPIKVEHLEGKLKLYHGTAFDSYSKIAKDGFLVATNYLNIKENSDNTITENLFKEKYYKMQTGYTFFSTDLSYILVYAMNHGGANAVGAVNDVHKSIRSVDMIEWWLESRGVIFEIDAEKYKDRLYYVPANGEYLIKGNVDIRDARVIFVNRKNGVVTLTDEKGDKINDLRYE